MSKRLKDIDAFSPDYLGNLDVADDPMEPTQESVTVTLPHLFSVREYQTEVWDNLVNKGVNRAILLWHRRAGKDKIVWNAVIARMQERVGSYWYMLPKTAQAKKAIWSGRGLDGVKFLQHIPAAMIRKTNEQDMSIHFWSGSILYVLGSDNFDRLVSSNPLGVVFSEYALTNPAAYDYIRPILRENGGWAFFVYTPRGRNHGFQLYERAKKNPRWYVSKLTVDDTTRENGQPLVSPADLDEERAEGMSEDMIQQEYFVSFDTAQEGTYFAREMKAMRADGRITRIPIEPNIRTYTFWDLGIRDDMAIWVMQPVGMELRVIAGYSASGYGMAHYITWLMKFAEKYDVRWDKHFGPHDLAVRELMTGVARIDTAKKMGITFEQVERPQAKQDSIDALRSLLPRIWFDDRRCNGELVDGIQYSHIINAMESYHRMPLAALPVHDWSSNISDAGQTFALGWRDQHRKAATSAPPTPASAWG